MFESSEFGKYLKEKREKEKLTQNDLATAIKKSAQYISNIENGKNNAPPNPSDIEALIKKLKLSEQDSKSFKQKAAADRNRLPNEQMQYIRKHRKLQDLINYGTDNNINDKRWAEVLAIISGGK